MAEQDHEEPGIGQGHAVRRGTAGLALALLAGLAAFLILGGAGGDAHRYNLLFESTGQIVDGNEVRIGGLSVGTVEEIDLTEDDQARIEITSEQQLHEGTTAVVRDTGLVGDADRYISITPGPNSAPPLPEGGTLDQSATTTAVDFDQVFDTFDRKTRDGLANFIRGQAATYVGKGKEANRAYKYFEPGVHQTNKLLDELNRDQRAFERFFVAGADVFTALADRQDDLSASLTNARTAFDAIASENEALSEDLRLLAPAFRQSNTTFVNLRSTLDVLDRFVEVAKPATEDLAPFLRDLRPLLADSIPVFRNLADVVDRPGPHNDLGEITRSLPEVERRSRSGFRNARRAIRDFQPTLEFARAYAPDMVNSLAKLGQITARYDANGHYVSARVTAGNIFERNDATGVLEPLPNSERLNGFTPPDSAPRPCPGGVTQPAPDGSNPFVDPPFPASGLTADDCDPTQVPPGP